MPGPEQPNKPNQIHLPLLTPTDLPPQEAATATCQLLTAVVGQLPLAVAVLEGSDYRIKLANPAMYEIWQLPPGDKLGEPVFDAFPLIANQGLGELLDQVRRTGLAARGEELPSEFIRDGKQTTVYIDFVYSPLANQTSQLPDILVSATDVTERVLARRVLEETTQQLRGLVESAPFPIAVYSGREMRIELANQAIIDVYGKGPDVIGKCYPELLPELASQGIFEQLQSVYNTGVPFSSGTSRVDIDHQGELIPYYFNYNFTPLFDAAGRVYGVMNTGADVTPLELARQQVEQTATALQNAIELAELGNFSVDIATNLLTVSPRVATWFGFDSLAHDAETFIMGVGERERDYVRTSLYNTLLPESDGRYDVIHSVVNAKTGRSVILHALGQVYFNAVGEPLRIEGTAQDITSQRELQDMLEQQVKERTEELAATNEELAAINEELAATNEELESNNEGYVVLNEDLEESNRLLLRSNDNLQQFAYVASHDLQEPLRKIQQFGDLLTTRYADSVGEELVYVERIQSAAKRMSILIKDLLDFSLISTQRDVGGTVSLQTVVESALSTLELRVEELGAQIRVEQLPTLSGNASQLTQLFQNLLSNALKFHRPGVAPVIEIKTRRVASDELPSGITPSRVAPAYQLIEVIDNGIGFEEKYVDRIFQVFQRLHGKSAYIGTGIGLAICEKVVINHGGAITARSQPGQGAAFTIYLST